MAESTLIEQKARRKAATFPDMQCGRCGTRCRRGSAIQRFCKPCAKETTATRERERHRPKQPKIGAQMRCLGCGQHAKRTGSAQKYCPPCAKSSLQLRDRIAQATRRGTDDARAKERARARIRNAAPERRTYVREYEKKRRVKDPKFAVHARMKAMVQNALRGRKAGRSWEGLVGYTLDELMRHLERQFLPGMTWENRQLWQIDHIVPVSSFQFDRAEDDNLKACWALPNLRPLWKEENREKWFHRTHLI